MAVNNTDSPEIFKLTDCLYFTNGSCIFQNKCRYRHCETAIKQFKKCTNWPDSCRDVTCPYRHPKSFKKSEQTTSPPPPPLVSPVKQQGLVSFCWDIENVPIPRGQQPFDIVQRIRQKIVTERNLQEANFSCYCNIASIPAEKQRNLFEATVRIIHVPDPKTGAVDRQIMLDLDRFERTHKAPATIVLISGDIDFIGKLSDLRHQAGFYVIVIHNKVAKEQLKATVNEHYPWELFTNPSISNSNIVKQKEIPMMPLMELPNVGKSVSSTPGQPPPVNRCRGNVDRPSSHSADTKLPLKPLMSVCVDSTLNVKETSTPIVRPRLRSGRSITRLNQQKKSSFTSHENIPAAVDKNIDEKTEKNPSILFPCPHCTNEFDTIKALHQHQRDKKHLFDCLECNEGFVTLKGLQQHRIAKKHDFNLPESNSTIPKHKKQSTSKKQSLDNSNENNIAPVFSDED